MNRAPVGEMPFLDHLEELRWRIIWSLAALVVGVGAGFWIVFRLDLLTWLQGPILPFLQGRRLAYTNPSEGFSIAFQLSILIGLVVALPVILYQLWLFFSPALHRHEKKVVLPVILGVVLLFLAGAALAWYFVLPMTLGFMFSIGNEAFDAMITAREYFSFVTSMVFALGAVFELPVAILLLSIFGLVTPQMLGRFRKHALVGSYLVAAVITPGDLFISSVMLVIPLYLLYEVSIGLSWMVFRRRERSDLAEQSAPGAVA